MEFSTLCNRIFWDCILLYRREGNMNIYQKMSNPYKKKSVEAMLFQKNWIDNVQWDLEDVIRNPDIDPASALSIKRWIDKSNQQRTDLGRRGAAFKQFFKRRFGLSA